MRILEVRKNGSLVVSGRGLRRIIDHPGNRIAMDLVPADEAADIVRLHNDCFPDRSHWCEAITYREVYRRATAAASAKRR